MVNLNRLSTGLVVVTALSLFAVLLYGLAGLSYPDAIRFSRVGLRGFVASVAILSLIGALVAWRTRLSETGCLLLVSGVVAVVCGQIWSLLVVFVFWWISAALGRRLTEWVDPVSVTTLGVSTHFLLGAGLIGTVLSIAVHFPVNNTATYSLLAILILSICRTAASLVWREVILDCRSTRALDFKSQWGHAILAGLCGVYVLVAFMPEFGHDALAMHLFIPAHVAANGFWGFDVQKYVWAYMPALGDWIYAFTYMFAGESAARLTNVLFLGALLAQVRWLCTWAGGRASSAPLWAGILLLSSPLTFMEGTSLFIECIWASFIVGGTILVFRVVSNAPLRRVEVVLAGLLLGFAAASKAVTFTVLPVLMVLLLLRGNRWCRREHAKSVAWGLAGFLLVGSLPYVIAYLHTSNPLFPFYNAIFRSEFYPAENFADVRFPVGVDLMTLWDITLNTKRYLESFPGGAGFHWFVFLIPCILAFSIAKARRGLLVVLVGVATLVSCFQAMAYLRYVFPASVLLTAMVGVLLSIIPRERKVISWVTSSAASVVILLNLMFISNASFYHEFPWRSAVEVRAREEALRKLHPSRAALQVIDGLNHARTNVAMFSTPAGGDARSDVLHPNWYNYSFLTDVKNAASPADLGGVLKSWSVEYLLVDESFADLAPVTISNALEVSIPIAQFGSVSARRLKRDYEFARERLSNSDLRADSGWSQPLSRRGSKGGVVVSTETAVHQTVEVVAGSRYLHSVTAACFESPAKGRLQVRWLDDRQKFLKVDISVFECVHEPKVIEQIWVAPVGARFAEVWMSGHTAATLEFTRQSFKD